MTIRIREIRKTQGMTIEQHSRLTASVAMCDNFPEPTRERIMDFVMACIIAVAGISVIAYALGAID